ncbi:hypothetical protein ABT300_25510 [Streptomyces sp. NPDC001027]|uniref:hypothetical protein n=1 Tax=Streptomyces sp. NPDC001027 TaxID=3154771 RepID=UPI00332A8331
MNIATTSAVKYVAGLAPRAAVLAGAHRQAPVVARWPEAGMGALLGVGAADGAAVDFDVASGLEAADRPAYGGTLRVARLLDSVDDAGETGDRGGYRGAVDAAAPAGLAAHVRQHGPLHSPESS